MAKLSDDAKIIAGIWFGPMGGKSEVKMHLRDSRPTARCQRALGELLDAGVIVCETLNQFGVLVYKPAKPCQQYWRWAQRHMVKGNFKLMEPLTASNPLDDSLKSFAGSSLDDRVVKVLFANEGAARNFYDAVAVIAANVLAPRRKRKAA